MPDDKAKQDSHDRDRVAGDQDYEVLYLSAKAGISAEQARDLIEKYGNDREKLMQEAWKLT